MYGRALRLIRKFHHLKQNELSEKLGFSKSYISEMEKGHKDPSLDVLKKYAEHFKIPLSSLQLFAEQLEGGSPVEAGRVVAADKVLKMLEWIASISDTDGN